MVILFVAMGCALGGICRYLGMTAVTKRWGDVFPWGTLVVNVVGSFLLGLVLGADLLSITSYEAYACGAIAFSGALTTFSTFSLQTLTLVSQQQWKPAAYNIFGSALLCMICALGGYTISQGVMG